MSLPKELLIILAVFLTSCVSANAPMPDSPVVEKEVVYLLHGLGRSSFAMWVLASRLEDAGVLVNNIRLYSLPTE